VYAARSGISVTQSTTLLKWLHDHREIKEVEILKKNTT